VLQVQFQDIEDDGIAQFGNGSRQVVVSPPAFAAGTLRFPYA
jgi:branched-chain amino acid transport system substrate-binding protein